MASYKNRTLHSAIRGAEFTPVSDGNFTFVYVDPARLDEAQAWLSSPAVNQEIIAQSPSGNNLVLVTHGNKNKGDLLKAFSEHGDHLYFHHQTKSFSDLAWPIRSALGISGQVLQLTSSLLRGKRDLPLFVFAVSNLAANGINVAFGSQKSDDVNRLRFLKGAINAQLTPTTPDGATLPEPDDNRVALRQETDEKGDAIHKTQGFLKRHSVSFGELGLRYTGATAMAFDKNRLRRYAGMGSLTGKTIALGSKAEDPYNPKSHTVLDSIREKLTFRAGGMIEAVSFATLAYDGFTRGKIKLRGKEYRDYLSGIGGVLFTVAYIVRNWAKYGEKEVNMKELYAHVTDSLATMPPEQLPQLMAEVAAFIQDQFKEKKLDFGQIYTDLTTDLYRYHHLAMKQQTLPEKRVANENTPSVTIGAMHASRVRAGQHEPLLAAQR